MFSLPINTTILEVDYSYSIPLVILSIFAAIIGALIALICNVRIRENSFIGKNIWLAMAAFSMALGIWSMHFIGMAALILPAKVTYGFYLTAISFVPAFLASLLAFYIVNKVKKNWKLHFFASVLMGIGIASMHYIGMSAMVYENIHHYYNPFWFACSIVIAVAISFVAFYIFSDAFLYRLKLSWRILTAILLGVAISSMHYVGLKAMNFYVDVGAKHNISLAGQKTFDSVVFNTTIALSLIVMGLLLFLAIFSDRYFEDRLNFFDPLTKLPNARLFHKRIENQSIAYAMAIIQLDNLGEYSERYGYLFSDQLIGYVSRLLKEYSPTLVSIYRIEKKRFVFVATDVATSKVLEKKLFIISELLKSSIMVEDKRVLLKGSCSIIINEHVEPAKQLYLDASSVINYPSIDKTFEVTYFDMAYHKRNFEDEIKEDFNEAMRNGDLFVVYQPKINPNGNKIQSAEALIRWQHSKHGFLSPGLFLPILEANNQMDVLTDWIIEEVCKTLKDWKSIPVMPTQVAINIPGPYLTSSRLMQCLKHMTEKYQIPPSSIELEITETHFVKTIASAEKAVRNFRLEGFFVALDDFGTGVSSLSYLKKIPITTLKIDKSFVDGVPMSQKDSSIIQSIIQLGNSLNLTVVVEGIETVEQVQFLKDHCDGPQMQGFYYAKPMRQEELMSWCSAFRIQMGV